MKINLSDRVADCNRRISEMVRELNEYQSLNIAIKALSSVDIKEPNVKYDAADYEKLVNHVYKICAKHEIVLPEYVEWSTIELI